MEAGKHGVIVLNRLKRPSGRSASESSDETDAELADSNDPAVIKRIVRRQAALSSASRRKATLAAVHQKRSTGSRTVVRYGSTQSGALQSPLLFPQALAVGQHRFDPFAAQVVDIDNMRDSGNMRTLFTLFMEHVAPILDLRLPTQADLRHGRRYSWQTELPRLVLSCEPLFWSLMLSGAVQQSLMTTATYDGRSVTTLSFRQMAIESINTALRGDESGLDNNLGLLLGIAILGSWEHWYGSAEACRAHCDGLKLLSKHFTEEKQPHDLYPQIMTFANTFCSGAKQEPTYVQEVPDIVEIETEVNVGFRWLGRRTQLDEVLVQCVSNCKGIEGMAPGKDRDQATRALAAAIVGFNTKRRISGRWQMRVDRDGERMNVEMHIILQAAGVSLLNFLAGSAERAGTNDIDAAGMCDEMSDLAQSVACAPMYDQLLLWSVVTIFAMNGKLPLRGQGVIRKLVDRLQLYLLPVEGIVSYMEAFVLLDAARAKYTKLLLSVLPEVVSESSPE